jgi:hypothetical protein
MQIPVLIEQPQSSDSVIDLHPRGNASMDDSRESIYSGDE